MITSLRRLTAYTGQLHEWYNGECQPAPSDEQPWLAVGESVPLDSLPEVEETEL